MSASPIDLNSILSPLPAPYDQLRVNAAIIYTADPARPVIPGGSMLVEGNAIVAVGTTGEVDAIQASRGTPSGRTRILDAANSMLMPGLVNNHWHEAGVLRAMQGGAADPDDANTPPSEMANGGNCEAVSKLFNQLVDVGQAVPPEIGRVSALQAFVTQLRSGTTCLADFGSLNSPDVMAQAILDTGIRGVISVYGVDGEIRPADQHYLRTRDTNAILAELDRALAQYARHSSGRLRAMPSVLWGLNASDALLTGSEALARQYDTPWGTHICASGNESGACMACFGARPIERLRRLGLLSDRLICAHTAFADDDEFDWLVGAGAHITYSPQKYGATGESTITGTRQILRFLRAGAKVTLSSDGDPVPLGHMPESMRMAWLACNETAGDSTVMTPMRALSMATLESARSLGWADEIGSLAAGKRADFVTVPIDDWRYVGMRRPLNSFLVMGGSGDVDTVVVDGRVLVERKIATFVDEKALSAAFLRASESFSQALGDSSAHVPG